MKLNRLVIAACFALTATPALADGKPSGGKDLARYLEGSWSIEAGPDIGPFPGIALGCDEAIVIEAPRPDDEWVEVRVPYVSGVRLEVTTLDDIFVIVAAPWAGFWKSADTFAVAPKDTIGAPRRDAARELTRC